jgi:hypothetical protein
MGLKPTIKNPLIIMLIVKKDCIAQRKGYNVYFFPISLPINVVFLSLFFPGSNVELN